MKLNKKQREQVRLMFGGHCAYCGHPLGEKWHADHVEPVVRKLEFVRAEGRPTTMRTTGEAWYPERDHIGNMMPACVPCNIRKGGEDVESFRRGMERSIEVMRSNHSAYRHALRFGLIVEQPAKVVFHFERAANAGVPEAFVPGFCGMPGCSDCEKHKAAHGVDVPAPRPLTQQENAAFRRAVLVAGKVVEPDAGVGEVDRG